MRCPPMNPPPPPTTTRSSFAIRLSSCFTDRPFVSGLDRGPHALGWRLSVADAYIVNVGNARQLFARQDAPAVEDLQRPARARERRRRQRNELRPRRGDDENVDCAD